MIKLLELSKATTYKKALYNLIIYLKQEGYYLSEYDVYEICKIKEPHLQNSYKFYLSLYDNRGHSVDKELTCIIEHAGNEYTISNYIKDSTTSLDTCEIFI